MDKLRELYASYATAAAAAKKKAGFLSNLLGTANSTQRQPCHEEFYRNVEGWMAEFLAGEPDSGQLLLLGQFMLREPVNHKKEPCYWFMYAAIGQLEVLVPMLDEQDCRTLAQLLGSLYKKLDRMPVQERLFQSLCGKAGLDSRKIK